MGGIELSPEATVAVGVLVGLVSTSIQSVGLTLQRKSHILEEEKEEQDGHEPRPPYRRRRWQIGMGMFLVSNVVGSTIQITTLPLPVLSTLQASGLVFNTACATLILSEPFTRYSLIGTLLVAAGAVLIAIFGALAEPSHNLDQLLQLLGRDQFLIWVSGTFLVVLGIIITLWFAKRYDNHRSSPRARLWIGMSYGGISGILSAHTLLLAKSAVELLVRTIVDRVNQFNRWQSWMILVGLIVLAISQLYYLHRGLKLCSTSVLYPFVFCVYNIIAIMDGLIYFHQTDRLSLLHACLIALGTVILLAGVVALSWRLSDEAVAQSARGRTLSSADIKSMAHRVATPQTALGPGLGLLDVDADMMDSDTDTGPADDEEALLEASGSRFNERTSLLRTSTEPKDGPPSSSKRSQAQRPRRKTLREDRSTLWDELNDRSDPTTTRRHFSIGNTSPYHAASPTSSRHPDYAGAGPSHAETMPSRRRETLPPLSALTFTWRLPSRIGDMRNLGQDSLRASQRSKSDAELSTPQIPFESDTEDDGTTDVNDHDDDEDNTEEGQIAERTPLVRSTNGSGSERRTSAVSSRAWGLSQPRTRRRRSEGAEPAVSWFKLLWWKRSSSRREDDTGGGGGGNT